MSVNMVNMKKASWLHLDITGKEAEDLLKEKGEDGSFLVRRSRSRKDHFTLSVLSCKKSEKEVHHVQIQNMDDGYDVYGGEAFATLPDLICHYMNQGLEQKTSVDRISLKHPQYTERDLCESWYHGSISGSQADKLLKEDGNKGCFLMRTSRSNPGNYVLSVLVDQDITRHIMVEKKENKYAIRDGKSFPTLQELVRHYQANAMCDKKDTNIQVVQPCISTKFPASRIVERSDGSEEDEQRVSREYDQLIRADPSDSTNEGAKQENRLKNRYKNILPFDHSRVRLKIQNPEEPGSEYINANHVWNKYDRATEAPFRRRHYIASQGCLPKTLCSFWDMIWQENITVLIMATKPIENGKFKSAEYWPKNKNEPREVESYSGRIRIEFLDEHPSKDYTMRTLRITKEEKNTSKPPQPRTIYQYHYMTWPDHGVPGDPGVMLEFLEKVNRHMAEAQKVNRHKTEADNVPLMVHCSAGIGRTGTIIVIDIIINQIEEFGLGCEIDILETCKLVRRQRPGMIQTQTQYSFVYSAIKYHVEVMKKRLDAQQSGSGEQVYSNTGPEQTIPTENGPQEGLYANVESSNNGNLRIAD